ncbi:GH43 family beta-xylosidase [Haloferula luteola]|uniref:GH43 family beta-xylosidase n=1 Tax=Haloferula luteola TaxID=595692 RepID=A0A840VCY3_9BACT|nr:family 43 glycosylhydrolase [Haloferula luteola]MBB5352488.1 GH43 family beta-xylosidase [Haloferula luteola]
MNSFCRIAPAALAFALPLFAESEPHFTNPLYQAEDPWVIRHGEDYYVCTSGPLNPTAVYVSKSKTLIERGEKVKVWEDADHFGRVFAPELHFIQGKWYIYFCADAEEYDWKHMAVVLEANTDDPLEGFSYKGILFTGDENGNAQANDFTTVTWDGKLYAFWGSLGDPKIRNSVMAPMDSPTQITAFRKETNHHAEGPRFLIHGNDLILTGAEGGFASKNYCLTALQYDPQLGPLDNRDAWKPIGTLLQSTDDVWGPSRASFTVSADGSENWIMYHSKIFPADDNGIRAANVKKFTYDADGHPTIGKPPGPADFQALPSGDPGLGKTIPAENWKLSGGAKLLTQAKNITAKGAIRGFDEEGASAAFQVEVPEDGVYRIVFRHANGVKIDAEQKSHPTAYPPGKGTLTLRVNGERIRRAEFHRTTSWDVWMLHGENVPLKAGQNQIELRREAGDNGEVALDFAAIRKAEAGLRGLLGTYYTGRDLKNETLRRIDPEIAFNWGEGSPDPLIDNDQFSVRWEGFIEPLFSEDYTFYAKSDNGRRLRVDGKWVIDEWNDAYDQTPSGTIRLEAGKRVPIVYEYYEDRGGANTRLEWSSPSQIREIVPSARLSPPKP